MTFGEKLQGLRKSRGLSQEELAGKLTVSRQAVSRWELNETMPETENVIQLSRIFGVSTDYLLLEDKESREDMPEKKEGHLSAQGWAHNAFALSLSVCVVGLLLAIGGWLLKQTVGPLVLGLIVQVVGIALFELAISRMEEQQRFPARTRFYTAACWLVSPIPVAGLGWVLMVFAVRPYHSVWSYTAYAVIYGLICAVVTAVLTWLRRRHAHRL